MSRIPTAEEFCKNFKPNGKTWQENFHQTMIEFAKLHVEAALKEASEKATCSEYMVGEYNVNKNSILNSYPLSNIK